MNALLRLITLNAARLLFVGGLLLALYAGLVWALSPEERPDAASIAAAEAALEASESEAAESGDGAVVPTEQAPEATTAPTPTEVTPTIDPEEIIAQAEQPAETTVQVLDAGGGSARVDEAIVVLEQFGYDIIAISPSSRTVSQTTVYYTQGSQAEAEALRAREPRFQTVEGNRGLSEGVDIHVLVGAEF